MEYFEIDHLKLRDDIMRPMIGHSSRGAPVMSTNKIRKLWTHKSILHEVKVEVNPQNSMESTNICVW